MRTVSRVVFTSDYLTYGAVFGMNMVRRDGRTFVAEEIAPGRMTIFEVIAIHLPDRAAVLLHIGFCGAGGARDFVEGWDAEANADAYATPVDIVPDFL